MRLYRVGDELATKNNSTVYIIYYLYLVNIFPATDWRLYFSVLHFLLIFSFRREMTVAIGCSHVRSQQDPLPAQQSPTLSIKSLPPLFVKLRRTHGITVISKRREKKKKVKLVGQKSRELSLDRASRDPAAAHECSRAVSLQEGRVSVLCSSSEAVFPYPLALCPTKVLSSATWCRDCERMYRCLFPTVFSPIKLFYVLILTKEGK